MEKVEFEYYNNIMHKNFLFFMFFLMVLLFFSCVFDIRSETDPFLYSGNFFSDSFNVLNLDNWEYLLYNVGLSSLKPENVFISNDNLILRIPKNSSDGAGIRSKLKFKQGIYSMRFISTTNNVTMDFMLMDSFGDRFFVRYIYSDFLSNMLIFAVETASTNIYQTNYVLSNNLTVAIDTMGNRISFLINDSLHFSIDYQVTGYVFVNIMIYLEEYNLLPFDRYVEVSEFLYKV